VNEDRKTLQQSLRETWMSVLGVISGAEAEVARAAGRLFETVGLRDEGGEAPHSTKEAAREAAHELVERVKRNRDSLERRVEEGVKTAVARVRNPIADELQALRERVEKLQRKVEEVSRRRREHHPHD
jgi:polyhydroxyalkanoate synthesis regulator phasin